VDLIIIILITILAVLLLVFGLLSLFSKKRAKVVKDKIKKLSKEDKYLAIEELRRVLKSSPNNRGVREKLADLYFEVKSHLAAIKEYTTLLNHGGAAFDSDEVRLFLKIAETYKDMGSIDDAKKFYLLAKRKDKFCIEANFNLGKIELEKNEFEKAIAFFKIVDKLAPDNLENYKFLGLAYYRVKKYKNALEKLLKFHRANAEDVDVSYLIGNCFYNLNRVDEALKYFYKVSSSPKYAGEVNFFLGNIHKKKKVYLKAIEDFTLAIKSGSLSDDKQLEAYYNLADSYVNIHDLNKAILNWRKILEINPAYKDVDEKVATYSQLNENSLLEKYLFGSASQFTSICKHFVKVYINRYSRLKGFVKFNKIQQQVNNSLEMYVEVSTKNFVELYYFLFMRSATTVGDLTLRIIYNKLRDEKIDKGVCVTAGNFSPTAKDFVESRMLELVEREKTSEILSKVKEMIGKE